jgi:hypothetical protein
MRGQQCDSNQYQYKSCPYRRRLHHCSNSYLLTFNQVGTSLDADSSRTIGWHGLDGSPQKSIPASFPRSIKHIWCVIVVVSGGTNVNLCLFSMLILNVIEKKEVSKIPECAAQSKAPLTHRLQVKTDTSGMQLCASLSNSEMHIEDIGRTVHICFPSANKISRPNEQ